MSILWYGHFRVRTARNGFKPAPIAWGTHPPPPCTFVREKYTVQVVGLHRLPRYPLMGPDRSLARCASLFFLRPEPPGQSSTKRQL